MTLRSIGLFVSVLLAGTTGLFACVFYESAPEDGLWTARVVAAFPHDVTAFTQGLVVYEGQMYEGTGRYGASSLRCVDIATGTIERMASLNSDYFGEGITVFGDRIYQMTWHNNIVIVYDVDTFAVLETLPYEREAWGLTNDGTHLIASDGSDTIRFLDPKTLQPVKHISVRAGNRMVEQLNELEYVHGEIWANIWYKDRIARISPVDGKLLGWIDLSELYPHEERKGEDVLNGIAFDAAADRLFVTGKNWPRLFEIEVACP